MRRLDRKAVAERIEPHLLPDLTSAQYDIVQRDPRDLLRYSRFDLAIKLLYLSSRDRGADMGAEIYADHIRAFSRGQFVEPGQREKNTLQKYIRRFNEIEADITEHGFDSDRSIVPISPDGTVLNGAHRVSAAIHAGKSICTVTIDLDRSNYSYEYFRDRGMPAHYLDAAAVKFIDVSDRVFLAFVWPRCASSDHETRQWFENIVYWRDLRLTRQGAENLLCEVYANADWMDAGDSRRVNLRGKTDACFAREGPVRVIAFEAESPESVHRLKDKMRRHFGAGKHSVHISDTPSEARSLARTAFNPNSENFLNQSRQTRFPGTQAKVQRVKRHCDQAGIRHDDLIFDTGMVLEAYGLREAADVDYLVMPESDVPDGHGLDNHGSVVRYHKVRPADLLLNPEHHFYFRGMKFVSLPQIVRMKQRRGEAKDKLDIALCRRCLEQDGSHALGNRLVSKVAYFKLRFRVRSREVVISVLHRMKLYDQVAYIYRRYWK